MTSGCDFRKYHRLKLKLEQELKSTDDEARFKRLQDLFRRNFPTKEQAIADVEAFFNQENSL